MSSINPSILEKANLLANIQDAVESIAESNYNETLSLISKSPLFSTDYDSISRIIYFASRVRPFSIPILVRLVDDLSEQLPNFKEAIIDDLFSRQFANVGRYYFLFKCFEKGIITLEKISNTIDFFLNKNLVNDATRLYIWFAPELENKFSEQFNRFQKPDQEQLSEMSTELRLFWENYDNLKKDEWGLLKEQRSAGINNNPKISAILKDNVDELKAIIQSEIENNNNNAKTEGDKSQFDPNERILPCCFDRCSIFLNSPTLLCCAAYLKAENTCKYLIEIGADVKLGDQANRTPMIMAVAGGASKELVSIVSCPESDDPIRAVLVAASNHRNDYIQKVNNSLNLAEQQKTIFGGILHQAAGTNNIRAGLFCLQGDNPIDVNNPNQSNETPLHYASLYGNVSFIQLLLSFPNININALTENHQTSLHLAMVSYSHQAALSLMNHPDICPLIPDEEEDNNTALHFAAQNGYFDIFEMILKRFPDTDINLQNKQKRTPLHLSLMFRSLDIAFSLLKNPKIDVNCKDQMDRTPLHIAVLLKNRELINLLLSFPNIDLSAQEMYHLTPLNYAERTKYQEGIDILKPLTPPPKEEKEEGDNNNK